MKHRRHRPGTASICFIVLWLAAALAGAAPARCEQSAAAEPLRDADILQAKALEFYRSGKYAEAVSLFQRVLAIQEKALGPEHPDVATTLNNLAGLYDTQGRSAEAEPLFKRALAIQEKALGPEHPGVATMLNNLALLYDHQGRSAEAEPLVKRALAIREKALGPEHPDVANTLNNLAALYYKQGRSAEAEPLYKRALAIQEKALGPEHPDVATTLNNLAALYYRQGRFGEAEPLLKRALAIQEKALGPEHPDVATALNNLAELYITQGRSAEAEPLVKRALAIREKALGPEHPDVATTLNNLAALYDKQGRFAEAEPLYKRALAIQEKALGPEHPNVANTLNNLAVLYNKQGRFAETEPLYKRALAIQEKALGPEHPSVASVLNNLAGLYDQQGRFAETEPLHKRALAIREKALGPEHPDVAIALNSLAEFYDNQGRFAEAEPLYKRALAIREKALGPEHPDVAITLNSLAELYDNQGRFAEAEPLYKRALAIREKALGPEHPDVAITLNSLAELYDNQGRFAEAEPLYKRALAIGEKALGPEHPDVAITLNSLAVLYYKQGRSAEAEPLYKRALAIGEKALGPEHPDVATRLSNLALLYYRQGRFGEAEPLLKRALAIQEKALGPEHPSVASVLNNLAGLYDQQGRFAEAEPLFKRALAIQEKALGPEHPDVVTALNNLAGLYDAQGRYAEALPLARALVKSHSSDLRSVPPTFWAARAAGLVDANEAVDTALIVAQRGAQNAAAAALNQVAVRFAAGSGRLADLVRRDQDLAAEAAGLDKALLAVVSKEPLNRNPAAEEASRTRLAAAEQEQENIGKHLDHDFPEYAALSRPKPLTFKEIQALLADDEALVVVRLGAQSDVWIVTRDAGTWTEVAVPAAQVAARVKALRTALDEDQPFDPALAYSLYKDLLEPVAATFSGKKRLSFVLDGALTSLPPQLLVASDPAGKALKDVDWLVRGHAVTVLPSVASLKVLRGKSAVAGAKVGKPMIGFAVTTFDSRKAFDNPKVLASLRPTRGGQMTAANLNELRDLSPLQDTADEIRHVAASLGAPERDLFVDAAVTQHRVETMRLDNYRVVYFATHGLLATELTKITKQKAEPALVLWLPETPTATEDGLLTASRVAQLKLNADWVVLSACNTAGYDDTPGAEALSGLAQAFFYAGGRSLLVSNWHVGSESTAALMTATFKASAADPTLSHGEALRAAMLAVMGDPKHPEWADPRYWAPFIVAGEPAKPAHGKPAKPAQGKTALKTAPL